MEIKKILTTTAACTLLILSGCDANTDADVEADMNADGTEVESQTDAETNMDDSNSAETGSITHATSRADVEATLEARLDALSSNFARAEVELNEMMGTTKDLSRDALNNLRVKKEAMVSAMAKMNDAAEENFAQAKIQAEAKMDDFEESYNEVVSKYKVEFDSDTDARVEGNANMQ